MQQIESSDGLFHDGNPATGEPGTIVSAAWLNGVQGSMSNSQAELATLLAAAGIKPDATRPGQVLAALQALFLGKTARSADSAGLEGHPASHFAKASDLAHPGSRPGRLVVTFRDTPEPGTLACNGAAVSRTAYAALFAAIGTKYGAGDGSSTFNLPNIPDGHALLAANGSVVGSLSVGEVISHTHTGTALSTGSEHIHFSSSAAYVTNGGNMAGGAGVGTGSQIPAGTHTHALSINATGATTNKAAGIKLLVCIAYE
ncbi:Phage-related protein [Laribacter hongkongensis HLHK9]|uniref:Phage-related protein n=1 Tax=Laribacter hongkongensis (strain HLHK9) TaxID=557598 RepID=C1D6M7_LARHH|nr:phage tail protein [Laribacter hongkongensis]ACO74134.1 Phage-related protein [Laribacter hongkongensis HLHK9]